MGTRRKLTARGGRSLHVYDTESTSSTQLTQAELVTSPDDGHVSILNQSWSALDWLNQHKGVIQ